MPKRESKRESKREFIVVSDDDSECEEPPSKRVCVTSGSVDLDGNTQGAARMPEVSTGVRSSALKTAAKIGDFEADYFLFRPFDLPKQMSSGVCLLFHRMLMDEKSTVFVYLSPEKLQCTVAQHVSSNHQLDKSMDPDMVKDMCEFKMQNNKNISTVEDVVHYLNWRRVCIFGEDDTCFLDFFEVADLDPDAALPRLAFGCPVVPLLALMQ
jgi:hypothetical protein